MSRPTLPPRNYPQTHNYMYDQPYRQPYNQPYPYHISGQYVEDPNQVTMITPEPSSSGGRSRSKSRRTSTIRRPRLEDPEMRKQRRSEGQVNTCVKYSVFFYNLLFWAVGAALLGIGIWGLVSKSVGLEGITSGFLDPMWLITILGAFIFIISTAGCLGALRENTCLLKTFSIVLGLIILAEITIVVLAYVYRDQGTTIVATWVDKAIVNYMDDPDTQFLLDSMQQDMECCGGQGPDDWDNNLYFNCSSPAQSKCGVPFSCCLKLDAGEIVNYQCGYGVRDETTSQKDVIYTDGCVKSIDDWLTQNLVLIGGIIGGIILVQAMSLCFVKSLIGDVKAIKAVWKT